MHNKQNEGRCLADLKTKQQKRIRRQALSALLALVIAFCISACTDDNSTSDSSYSATASSAPEMAGADALDLSQIPAYSGEASIVIGDNTPDFSEKDIEQGSEGVFIELSELDKLGRCGAAYACLSVETLCYEARESISDVHPTAWQHVEYDFVDGKSLYNRCHLLGHALTGLNAEPRNLITGTRYLNVEGMLDHEDDIADYIEETANHVLYRVTPIFEGKNLLASGVRMEAYSVEDEGEGICFDLYCYNVEPGVTIDYATGDSYADGSIASSDEEEREYVLNTKSMKFHLPECEKIADISEKNKKTYTGTRQSLMEKGYKPCGYCNP